MRIFISSTLKSEWNREYNQRVCAALESAGFLCYLPQRDVHPESARTVFLQNTNAIRRADVLLAVAKNENANLGVELGFAFGINKPVIILAGQQDRIPSMLAGMGGEILRFPDLDSIQTYIDELIRKLQSRARCESVEKGPDLKGA
ncbi:MAG: hypothetical protein EHM61_05345 [Acidobacteria bacterium]|nr:MAG: hypothetical protein EHM61_05345 [Acidobacteriota bacterium]